MQTVTPSTRAQRLFALVAALTTGPLACGDAGSGTESEGHDTHHETEHDTHETTGGSTHATHDTTMTTAGSTHDSHGETSTGGHETHDSHDVTGPETTEATTSSDATTSGATSDATTGEPYTPPSAADYCECMLDVCHDLYHETWGEDHIAAEQMCLEWFESKPSAGMPAMSGDNQECLAYHCDAAVDDEGLCSGAIGMGVCQA